MQAQAAPLLPLLRSRRQADLLTLLLLNPQREWTLSELAARVGASIATAQREVARAEQTGVITSRRLGNTRLVTAADSPLTGDVTIRTPQWWKAGATPSMKRSNVGPSSVSRMRVTDELATGPGPDR